MVDKRIDTTLNGTVTNRRLVAKGAAAGGLAALFAAVGAGRALGDDTPDTIAGVDDSPDTSPDLDDSPDTTPGRPDEADTSPDDGETTNDNKVKGVSKKRRNGKKGRH